MSDQARQEVEISLIKEKVDIDAGNDAAIAELKQILEKEVASLTNAGLAATSSLGAICQVKVWLDAIHDFNKVFRDSDRLSTASEALKISAKLLEACTEDRKDEPDKIASSANEIKRLLQKGFAILKKPELVAMSMDDTNSPMEQIEQIAHGRLTQLPRASDDIGDLDPEVKDCLDYLDFARKGLHQCISFEAILDLICEDSTSPSEEETKCAEPLHGYAVAKLKERRNG